MKIIIFRLLCTKGVLIEEIKYSMFEAFALNEIVDGYEPEINISGDDLTRLCIALIG